jgi:TolB-like protein/Tfp pilus assembly protein PilF
VIKRFLAELQRRKVFRVASAYVVAGWIVLQVATTLEGTLNLPDGFDRLVLALLAAGLPIALILAWTFDMTPEGIRRTHGVGSGVVAAPGATDVLLAGMVVVVIVAAIAQSFMSDPTDVAATATRKEPQDQEADGRAAARTADPKSIAVLPFLNLSTDKDTEYFADGLTEEILNVLAQLQDLKVISRTSSFSFKGREVPLPDIARQLGVRHILEGSVRSAGERVRITAQLIDVSTDVHLWSQTYDRNIGDLFAVQDEIATAIATALHLELDMTAASRDAPTGNVEAYRSFLKARELFRRRGEHDLPESIELYKKAIKFDPNFAEAYAGLAASYTSEGSKDARKFGEFESLAVQAAKKALELKPELAQPYAVLGSIACDRLDWAAAFKNGKTAVELDPSDSTALLWLGLTQLAAGHTDEAASSLEKAARIDPLYTFLDLWRLRIAYARNDNAGGAAIAKKMLQSTPEAVVSAHWYLASVAQDRGDHDNAEEHFRAAMKIAGSNAGIIEPVVRALRSPDALADARRALQEETARDAEFTPELLYLMIGDSDAYFDTIDAYYQRGDTTRVTHLMGLAWRLPKSAWAKSATAHALLKQSGLVGYWKKVGAPKRCRPAGLEDFECG